ncbi:Uncharacterized protein TCM_010723 [Theobroma cacao]|uniref:HXXXD-type acyl-transferase family protein n=1 Tax=Theobroma cacao TaxID=3641 RepID=A0A061E840_THECC|nr:Uncharacterized protein TCM_010723 [Theobroma cacao]
MKLEVEVISEEIIKPSSPTPHQFCHYQLSSLDQLAPQVYNHLVLFFPTTSDVQIDKIKNTLDHLKLSFLQNPVPRELNKLFPFALNDAVELPMGIQFNTFDFGGIGIGLCISHKIGDALSYFTFLNTWAAIARGDQKNVVSPEFLSAVLFPPRIMSSLPEPEMRDSIRKIDKEYVRKLQVGEDLFDSINEVNESSNKEETVPFVFTSLCRFPAYEADFGRGKPIWVSSASLTTKNLVVFMDTASDLIMDCPGTLYIIQMQHSEEAYFETQGGNAINSSKEA